MEWLYNGIGGITQAEGSVAYDSIVIDPRPVGDLTWAEITHNCVKGLISVRWEKNNGTVDLSFTIPVNCRAEVRFNGKYIGKFGSGSYKLTITA
jgi:alpha-L-rhamnosidase